MKVAVVNDSKTAAEVLRRILAELPGFSLAWTAYSGEEAVLLAATKTPDIILMDLIMPGIDGAETTRQIMQATPCVILVVTATTTGNRNLVFEAMSHGALDAVNTPVLGVDGDMTGAEPLLQKLRTVARLVTPAPKPAAPSLVPPTENQRIASALHRAVRRPSGFSSAEHRVAAGSGLPIVAIGASTGGPQALAQILSALPEDFPAAILIVQHVDEHFAPGLADWLQHNTPLPVRIARQGERLAAATVYIAGTNDHLVVDSHFLRYTPHPRDTVYRPSVDTLFASLAQQRAQRIGVLLTGMGRDGAEGLLALRNAGALTLAQDSDSSVVFGMPRAAAELDAAVEILPLAAIGPRIRDAILLSHRKEKP